MFKYYANYIFDCCDKLQFVFVEITYHTVNVVFTLFHVWSSPEKSIFRFIGHCQFSENSVRLLTCKVCSFASTMNLQILGQFVENSKILCCSFYALQLLINVVCPAFSPVVQAARWHDFTCYSRSIKRQDFTAVPLKLEWASLCSAKQEYCCSQHLTRCTTVLCLCGGWGHWRSL